MIALRLIAIFTATVAVVLAVGVMVCTPA